MGVGATLTSDPDASHARLPERHGATAANEVIMGWLEGVADGCPELRVEFPYLRGDDEVAPLTVAYTSGRKVAREAELNRVDLDVALGRCTEGA
jgi:hypothetical protein